MKIRTMVKTAAVQLSPASRAYLLGDSDDPRIRGVLTRAGYLDDDGRLTPFGAAVAHAAKGSLSLWTADDSAALDAEIRASRKPRPKISKKADPDLADACRKIMKYSLKERSTYRMKGDGLSGFGRNEPTRAFS